MNHPRKKRYPWIPTTSKLIQSALREMAEQHGYTAERGSYAKQGNASEVIQAWYYGELATVLLDSDDRWQVIHGLERHAQTLEDTHLSELLQAVASQLRDATKREQRVQTD